MPRNYTYDEYLGFEALSNVKHEFLDGQIYAMAGGTPEHAALAAAAITLLGPQLRGGDCRPYNSDLRVRTPTGLTTYPDVTVICGPREIDGVDPLAITNPTLIVEVLSRRPRSTTRATSSSTTRPSRPCVSTCSCLTARAPWRSGRAKKTVAKRPSFPKMGSQSSRSAHGSTFVSSTRPRRSRLRSVHRRWPLPHPLCSRPKYGLRRCCSWCMGSTRKLNTLTPRDALNALYEWQQCLRWRQMPRTRSSALARGC